MIAQELEVSLHMAFMEARQARHEFITVEHLLLALLDNPTAAEVLRACAANIEDLRQNLRNFIHDNTPTVPGTDHTREYVPLLALGRKVRNGTDLGLRATLSDIGQTVAENFGARIAHGASFLPQIL